MATNTGGVRWAPAKAATKKLLSAKQIVQRMKITYPLLTAARVDPGLRRLFISELITQDVNEGKEVILPEGAMIKMVPKDTYK